MAVLETHEVDENILRLRLNRPDKLNALSKELLAEISRSVRSADGHYRVLILEGAGDAFTSGADLDEAQETDEDIELFQDMTRSVMEFQGIVIGKLHGYVIGGGFEFTLGFDLRYAQTGTIFKMTESTIGLPVSNASTLLLPLTIGLGKAKELIYTSRDLGAEEAEELGLVSGVYGSEQLERKVLSVARDIAENKSLPALELNKRGLNAAFPVPETLDYESLLFRVCQSMTGGEVNW